MTRWWTQPMLDLEKLKMGDSIYLKKKKAYPELVKRYIYNIIIVGGR
jgi:hypothetical protein